MLLGRNPVDRGLEHLCSPNTPLFPLSGPRGHRVFRGSRVRGSVEDHSLSSAPRGWACIRLQLACATDPRDLRGGPERTCFARFRVKSTALRYEDGRRTRRGLLVAASIRRSV